MAYIHRLLASTYLQIITFVAALVAIVALVGLLSYQSCARAVEQAQTNAQNMAEIISDDIEQTFSKAHSDIHSFALFVKPEDLQPAGSSKRRAEIEALMASHLTGFTQIANYRVFAANGDTVYNVGKNPVNFNVSDRQWFTDLRDHAELQLSISEVLIGKGTQSPTIIIAVPIRGPQGQFWGSVNAALDLSYLQRLIERPDIGSQGMIAIRRSESAKLIVRRPMTELLTNASVATPITQRIMAGEPEGSMEMVSAVDHIARMMAFKRARNYPIATMVGLAESDFLAQWRLQTWAVGSTTLLVASLLTLLFVRQRSTQTHLNRELAERKRAEAALKESELRLHTVVDSTREGIAVHQNGLIVFVNSAMNHIMGAPTAGAMLGKAVMDFVHRDYHALVQSRLREQAGHGQPMQPIEQKFIRFDGRVIDVEVQGSPIVYMGQPAIQVAVRDITEQKLLADRLTLATNVFDHAREGITVTDVLGTIVETNEAFTRITGYSREEAVGHNMRLLRSGHQDPTFYDSMWQALTTVGHWSGEVWNRRKSGEEYAELVNISAVRDAQGQTQKYVGLFSDITSIKEHQRQLEHIAHFDALTNLPNRLLLADRLQQAMVQALRRGQLVAVVYLDLDGFKGVNDQYGHDMGDQLLIHLANAMKHTLREGDTLARLGGDEFVAVLIDLDGVDTCMPMVNRLMDAAAAPVQLADLLLKCSASIGVSFYPQDQEVEADQLLRQADQAMYHAKLAGKNRFHVFDAAHDSSLRSHNETVERIGLALKRREFVLHYQPKVNMRTGQVLGVEALIRWQHPDKGLLAPGTFLPVIEDHPLAVELGEWVIDAALTQIETWHRGGLSLGVSVNIGARQLQHVDFVDRLRAALAQHPEVKPTSLELEVLETSALAEMEQVSQVIEDCRNMGVKFALDDFGTGYSSLTYLKRLRVAMLKIDQSFVRDMLDDPDDLAILVGVIGLAAAFKRDVIAEGVETVAHGTALLGLGCELAQGYGIARPMAPELIPAWVISWRSDSAWA